MSTQQRCSSRQSRRLHTLLTVGIAGVGLATASVHAQTRIASTDDGLQEIVVTAEKRDSTVQKTPFSITAVSGEQLQSQGLSSMEDVAQETPGISMRSSGPGQTEYEMRGLASGGGASSTVGFYLNDIPLAAPAGSFTGHVTIDPDLYDLNRVEVLRGPQGTLYGSGSMGGTIRLETNEPDLKKFGGSAQLIGSGTAGGGANYGGSAMLNVPLIEDHLAIRLVATDKYYDGWIDRLVVNPFPIGPTGACGWQSCTRGNVAAAPVTESFPRSNWEKLSGARGEILFKPIDELSIDVLAMYQKMTLGGFSQVDDPPGPDTLDHYEPFDISEPYEDIFRIYALTINYDFSFAKLSSASSSWNRNSVWTGDVSETFQNLLSTEYAINAPLIPLRYYNDDPSQQISEELRLTSSGEGNLQWVVGGFYSRFQSTFNQYLAEPYYASISTGGPAANPLGIIYAPNQPYHIKQYAAFFDASYQFLSKYKLTVGARYYKYDSEVVSEQSGLFTVTGNATPSYGTATAAESGVNPKINFSYMPTGDLTVYAQAAKGFRPGGVNIAVPPTCTVQPSESYSPDSIWNYEVGEKARFLGGRLSVNADVYYIVWKNIQEELNQTCGFPYTANIGEAVSYGPELEVNMKVIDHLNVGFNGAYTQAYLRSISAGVQGTIGSTTALVPGLRLDNVPHYTMNAFATYDFPITDTYKVMARVSSTTIGPTYDISYYTQQIPGYTMYNARIGLLGGAFVPYIFVDNLTNKHAVTTIDTQEWAAATPAFNRDAIITPRTIGIDLQYKF